MLTKPSFTDARALLLNCVEPLGTQELPLEDCAGRVLAMELRAAEDVPSFDRSPYDGYAFRSADTHATPVTLKLLEELPAGSTPSTRVSEGTAVKLLTGAPIPEGADAVCKFEDTQFTPSSVTLHKRYKSGANIVRAGEDVKKGTLLAQVGDIIDAGLSASLAAQGIARPKVYRVPVIGVLSTGSELVEPSFSPGMGKIRNTNRYLIETELRMRGFETVYLGTAGDSVDEISTLLEKGLSFCDAIVSTGGVSVGDYDFTPAAMEKVGAQQLIRAVAIKPGMACAYGLRGNKLICALSGNPSAAIINLLLVAMPALKKLAGRRNALPQELKVKLGNAFDKRSPQNRVLRGSIELSDGTARFKLLQNQGNVAISSSIGSNALVLVPAGKNELPEGSELCAYIV